MIKSPDPTIYEKVFVKSDKTDAVLVVHGRKLHVNKALLSYHSDYFKTLFNSEFKEKSMEEIEIKDIHFGNFATLLSLVQEKPLQINKGNAVSLLRLADRFLLNAAKYPIVIFIKFSPDFSRYEKLILADRLKSEKLVKHAVGLYDSKKSFDDFWCAENCKFSDNLKAKLFDSFFNRYAGSF